MTCTEGGAGSSGSHTEVSADGTSELVDPAIVEVMDPTMYAFIAVAVVFGLAVLVFGWLFRSYLHTGYLRTHEEVLRTGKAGVGTLFSGGNRFLAMAGLKLMKWGIVLGSALLVLSPALCAGGLGAAVPEHVTPDLVSMVVLAFGGLSVLVTLFVSLGFSFAEHALVFEALGPTAALARSWRVMSGHRLDLFLYYLLALLVVIPVALAGVCLCGVGVLVTLPAARSWIDVGLSEGWLLMHRRRAETDGWAAYKLD